MMKMRVLVLAGLGASAIALSGCAGTTPAVLATDISAIESQVQADANLVCGFIPTIATIASFIPGVGTIAAGAGSIAEAICGAVAKAPPVVVASARRRSAGLADVNVATVYVPNVGPVPISGKFTR